MTIFPSISECNSCFSYEISTIIKSKKEAGFADLLGTNEKYKKMIMNYSSYLMVLLRTEVASSNCCKAIS